MRKLLGVGRAVMAVGLLFVLEIIGRSDAGGRNQGGLLTTSLGLCFFGGLGIIMRNAQIIVKLVLEALQLLIGLSPINLRFCCFGPFQIHRVFDSLQGL